MEAAQHAGMNNIQPNDNTRFDRLEALIRSQIGGLRAEVSGLRAEMVSELAGVKAEVNGLRAEVGGLKDDFGGLTFEVGDLKAEVWGLREEMVGELGSLKTEVGGLKTEVGGLNVRLDTLHSQIKIVAEGHGALVDNIEDVKAGIARLETGQDHLQLRMIAVESRLGLTR